VASAVAGAVGGAPGPVVGQQGQPGPAVARRVVVALGPPDVQVEVGVLADVRGRSAAQLAGGVAPPVNSAGGHKR